METITTSSPRTGDANGRVLIIAPSFRSYGVMIERAFKELGWETNLYELTQTTLSFPRAVLWTCSKAYRKRMDSKNARLYTEEISARLANQKPDLCLVINGNLLDREILMRIRGSRAKTVLWCYDSVARYPNMIERAELCDRIYVFEPSDLAILEEKGLYGKCLPMAYDPLTYYPMSDCRKEIDVSFVGTLFAYPERLDFIRRFVRRNSGLSIRIWTNTPPWYSPKRVLMCIHVFSAFARVTSMKTLSHSEVNQIYNSSKICLNVHHWQSKEGLNPRVFEILGSGGFQLVDHRQQVGELFDDETAPVSYTSEADLDRKISYYLEEEQARLKKAEAGHRKVKYSHTYSHRVETILRDLQL